jgi:hypothetical protein
MCPELEVTESGEVIVARVQGFIEADALLAALRANGIEARTVGEAAGVVYGLTLDGLGETAIVVRPEQAQAALDLLAAADRHELEVADDQPVGEETGG